MLMDGWIGWMDWTDGPMDGWMDGWMNEYVWCWMQNMVGALAQNSKKLLPLFALGSPSDIAVST